MPYVQKLKPISKQLKTKVEIIMKILKYTGKQQQHYNILKLVGCHESGIWRIIVLNAYIRKEFQTEISIRTKKIGKEQQNKPKERRGKERGVYESY